MVSEHRYDLFYKSVLKNLLLPTLCPEGSIERNSRIFYAFQLCINSCPELTIDFACKHPRDYWPWDIITTSADTNMIFERMDLPWDFGILSRRYKKKWKDWTRIG